MKLGRRQPATGTPAPASAEGSASTAAPGGEAAESPARAAVRTLYAMGELEACAAVAGGMIEDPVARRLRAFCLGERDDPAALEELTAVARDEPENEEVAASLLSQQLRRGLLPEAGAFRPDGPAGEYRGAAAWLRGRHLAAAGRWQEATAEFHLAARYFREGPAESRAERLAGTYIGLAIAYLATGDAAAAQLAYSKTVAGEAPSPRLGELARRVFETADALRSLSAAELVDLSVELAEIVSRIQLRVRFHLPGRPPALFWEVD